MKKNINVQSYGANSLQAPSQIHGESVSISNWTDILPCDVEVATHFPAILQQLGVEKMKYICLKNKKWLKR